MFYVGSILAYIGAFTRWLLFRKKKLKEYYIGNKGDDLSAMLSNSFINRLIGVLILTLLFFIVGKYFQKV